MDVLTSRWKCVCCRCSFPKESCSGVLFLCLIRGSVQQGFTLPLWGACVYCVSINIVCIHIHLTVCRGVCVCVWMSGSAPNLKANGELMSLVCPCLFNSNIWEDKKRAFASLSMTRLVSDSLVSQRFQHFFQKCSSYAENYSLILNACTLFCWCSPVD